MNESRSFPDVFPKEVGASARGSAAAAPLPLAWRQDFKLGVAVVRPSVRTVDGPGGSAAAEPRVMQVLLALVDAEGAVLSRDDLIRICWNGQVVGDDSVNRAIAEVRRITRTTEAGFGVETIPRIGYRLSGATPESAGPVAQPLPETDGVAAGPVTKVTRRVAVGGAVAAAAGVLGLWFALRDRTDPRVAVLVERGRLAIRDELPESDAQGVRFLRAAVAIEPDNAEAWGLLSLALRNTVEHSSASETAPTVRDCEFAATRALAIDDREGNALAALAALRPAFGDWAAAEDRLRNVLAVVPDNVAARSHFGVLLQSTGQEQESARWLERTVQLEPLSPVLQLRLAWKQWMFGRTAEADQTIDRALQLWPRHAGVWNIRLMLYGLTGRSRAALAMIEDADSRPPTLLERQRSRWRLLLIALETRSPADVTAARAAIMAAAIRAPGSAVNGIMILSMLGETDAAFAVAQGYLLRRGPLIGPLRAGRGEVSVNDQRWRKTMMMFTPAVAAMQVDRRFLPLCAGMGLVDYWRRRGITPDFLQRS